LPTTSSRGAAFAAPAAVVPARAMLETAPAIIQDFLAVGFMGVSFKVRGGPGGLCLLVI
jgi:hypothetical protein